MSILISVSELFLVGLVHVVVAGRVQILFDVGAQVEIAGSPGVDDLSTVSLLRLYLLIRALI